MVGKVVSDWCLGFQDSLENPRTKEHFLETITF